MLRIVISLLLFLAAASQAGPMIPAGDTALRHDIQLLADQGIVQGTVSTWPLEWGPIIADIARVDDELELSAHVRAALARVRNKAQWDTRIRELRFRGRFAAQGEPSRLRSFQDTPREEAELSGGLSWTGERFSYDLNATIVSDPADDEDVRGDGSHLSVALGNMTFAASTLDRWWGPAWDSSLVLSSNARPMPAVTIDRRFTDASDSKWFSWLGPWDASLIWGWMEEERVVPNTQFVGFRFNFRPIPSLEIGLSRTAQWCGDDRPCDASTFWNILIGRDNPGDEGITPDTDPSNQTATVDFRWSLARTGVPMAIYGQFLGEDEAGGFPSRYLGQVGVEGHTYLADRWSTRWYLEAAATNCEFWKSEDNWDCAYNHSIYETGYRYRGRVIGHTSDNDSRIASLGVVLIDDEGTSWQGLVRYGSLNRGGAPDPANSLTPLRQDIWSIDLVHHRVTRYGRFEFGAGYERIDDFSDMQSSNEARGFIQWRSDY